MLRFSTRVIRTALGDALAGAVDGADAAGDPDALLGDGVCLLEFGAPERRATMVRELETLFGAACAEEQGSPRSACLSSLTEQLAGYFAGDLNAFDLPLCAPGTPFQRSVWKAMLRIPIGETMTYGGLARSIGRGPTAARAVGMASGRNRVSVLIPCHRVVDGSYDPGAGGARGLRGYGGGLANKQRLLEHEQALVKGEGLFGRPLAAP